MEPVPPEGTVRPGIAEHAYVAKAIARLGTPRRESDSPGPPPAPSLGEVRGLSHAITRPPATPEQARTLTITRPPQVFRRREAHRERGRRRAKPTVCVRTLGPISLSLLDTRLLDRLDLRVWTASAFWISRRSQVETAACCCQVPPAMRGGSAGGLSKRCGRAGNPAG